MEFLTHDELLAVLSAARETSYRDWLMMLMGYWHGMRANEICDMRLRDVNQIDHTVRIRRLKHSNTTLQPMVQSDNILLNEIDGIETHINRYAVYAKTGLMDGDAKLFPGVTYKTFYRRFATYAKKAGLPSEKQHPHVLKHSIANHSIRNGVGIESVQQFLGHKDIKSTMQYVKLSDREASEQVYAALRKVHSHES